MAELFEKINQKLVLSLPEKVKPVDWLIDNLEIGKESAYRRLRGDVLYQLDEACKIAKLLDFSLDDLVDRNQYARDNEGNTNINYFLKNYLAFIKKIASAKGAYSLVTATKLNIICAMEYEMLFKFFYFRNSLHSGVANKMSDITIPKETLDLRKEILDVHFSNHSFEYVFSRHVFSIIIDGIMYYLCCRKINQEEADILLQEFRHLLDKVERQMIEGVDECGNSRYYYLSMIDVEANSYAGGISGDAFTSLWTFENGLAAYPATVDAKSYVNAFNSRKKFSSLVTMSNEIDRTRFMEGQRALLELQEIKF